MILSLIFLFFFIDAEFCRGIKKQKECFFQFARIQYLTNICSSRLIIKFGRILSPKKKIGQGTFCKS